jgi:tetratricopeptide (TPR) repeat protein
MGQATIIAPDVPPPSGRVQLAAFNAGVPEQHPSNGQTTRPDAAAIAKAVIQHLNGDAKGALQILLSVDREFETPDLLAALGYIQSELGSHEDAAVCYGKLVFKEPEAAEGWFQWGYCLYKLGRTTDALERFQKAAFLRSDWIEIPLAESICHLSLKQYPAAFQRADDCLRLNPSHVPALFTKAVALHVTWELDKAAELYRQVLKLDANSAEALMNLITLGLQQKQYDVVQQYSEQLIALQPDNTLAIEGIATSAYNNEDYEKAWHYYTRLVELAPDQVSNWLNLGVTNEKRGLLAEAVQAFTKARLVKPDSLYAHSYLGSALWKSRNLLAARDCYQNAVSKWPEREELILSLSQVLEELNSIEAAEKTCADFCEHDPERKQVWFRLGYLQWLRENADGAVESFARALQLKPAWPEAEINLALACHRAGQYDRAESVLLGLLDREPENVEALKGLATVALAQNRLERSLELHEKLLQLTGTSADICYNCGVLAQNLNRMERAAQYYRDAIAARPGFPEALLNLGHALKALGQEDEARNVWIPALQQRPEFALGYFRRS